jgi:tRNA modification GTPase
MLSNKSLPNKGQDHSTSLSTASGMASDTIAAIATAAGKGGIGIVRISGPGAQDIAHLLFRKCSRQLSETFQPQYLYHGFIQDPRTDLVLDEVLLVLMRGPHSYTREDVVEIQSHGGPQTLKAILSTVLQNGARLAEPGEFTRRAFLNGRIDLSQAEAVADIINARSEEALRLAVAQLQGGLTSKVQDIIDAITHLIAEIEAGLEFPDDNLEILETRSFHQAVDKKIIPSVQQLIDSYQKGHLLRNGIRIVLAGRPNVGKSSLLNQLVGMERVIVTPIPGTTRDTVDAASMIGHLSAVFTDTAGIHPTDDPIEIIGIRRSEESIQDADLVFFLVDATQPFNPEDSIVFRKLLPKRAIIVINKIDLVGSPLFFNVPPIFKEFPIVKVCATSGEGIQALKRLTLEMFSDNEFGATNDTPLSDARHKQCLDETLEHLLRAREAFEQHVPEDLISSDLRHAADALKKVTGAQITTDVLDVIFEKFCIGK